MPQSLLPPPPPAPHTRAHAHEDLLRERRCHRLQQAGSVDALRVQRSEVLDRAALAKLHQQHALRGVPEPPPQRPRRQRRQSSALAADTSSCVAGPQTQPAVHSVHVCGGLAVGEGAATEAC
eukprot:COSAG01_NODE_45139_length_412_cov_0.811502_1_plen_121_part_01